MKKLLSFVIAFAIVMQSFGMGISTKANAAKLPKLNKTSVTLTVGSSYKLKVKNSKKKAKWKSSSKSVVTVNKSGKITAINEGKATITTTVAKKKLKCKVVVINSNNSSADAMTTEATETASDENKNCSDPEKLRRFIIEQKEKGANVDEDIYHSKQYWWMKKGTDENGEEILTDISTQYYKLYMLELSPTESELNWYKNYNEDELVLVGLYWDECGIIGDVKMPDFERLRDINVNKNSIENIDIQRCSLLENLYMNENKLAGNLDVSNNLKIRRIECFGNGMGSLRLKFNTSIGGRLGLQLQCDKSTDIQLCDEKDVEIPLSSAVSVQKPNKGQINFIFFTQKDNTTTVEIIFK